MTTGRLPEDAPDPRFDYALTALQAGAWADAARLFEQYVGTHPDSAPAWGNLSLAYRGLGDTPRQLAAARRATELHPSAQSSLLVLGEALFWSGLYAEALVHAQSALGRFPNDIAFLEVAAKAHDGLDQPEKAIKTARRAIRYSPFFNSIMHGLVAKNLLALGRLDAALEEYDRIIGNESPVPGIVGADPKLEALTSKTTALLLKAFRERTGAGWREMVAAGREALQLNPRDVRVLAALGVAHRWLAEFELSLDHLERAIDAGERDAYLSLHRGMTLNALGRNEEALADLDFAASNATDDAVRHEALTYRPLSLYGLGLLDETMQACDEAVAAGVDNPIIRNARGLIYLERGDGLEAAKSELERAQELDPSDCQAAKPHPYLDH